MSQREFDDIPGTPLFDGGMAQKGYHFNTFFMSLMKSDNRAAFKAGEAAYMENYSLSAEQKQAVLARDWNGMTALGGNVFFMVKLAATDGIAVAQMCASMAGMAPADYMRMMVAGGRPIAGNRSRDQNKAA
ncbi:MAG: Protocatechuate 4,5-dioxygenase [Betaproteobacteria bacterium]|nr:Protocatechuate 4,5-dioxygenase [Betaproteobacteria bacterium]